MKSLFSGVTAALLLGASAFAQASGTVVVITHEVKDFAVWKKAYDADATNRTKAGLVQKYLLRDADKPNSVTVIFEAPNAEAAKGFTTSPLLKEAMTKAGVVSSPAIVIGNVAK